MARKSNNSSSSRPDSGKWWIEHENDDLRIRKKSGPLKVSNKEMANVTDIIEGSDSSTIKVSMKRVETKTTCDGKNICHSNFFKFCTVTYQSGETLSGNFLYVYLFWIFRNVSWPKITRMETNLPICPWRICKSCTLTKSAF